MLFSSLLALLLIAPAGVAMAQDHKSKLWVERQGNKGLSLEYNAPTPESLKLKQPPRLKQARPQPRRYEPRREAVQRPASPPRARSSRELLNELEPVDARQASRQQPSSSRDIEPQGSAPEVRDYRSRPVEPRTYQRVERMPPARQTDNRAPTPQSAPAVRPAPRASSPRGIERDTLPPLNNAPVGRNDRRDRGAGLPPLAGSRTQQASGGPRAGLWQAMTFGAFRDRVLKLGAGSGSPVLNDLFVDALLNDDRYADAVDEETRELLKLVVLYRMGRIKDLLRHIERSQIAARSLPGKVFHARALLADGDHARACAIASRLPVGDPDLSPDLLSEALRMTALCAAQKKDLQTAGLMVDLARDRGIRAPIFYAVIDFLVSGIKPTTKMPAQLGLLDYFFLRLTGQKAPMKLLHMAEPALLHALAHDRRSPLELRIAAADQAGRAGQLDGIGLTGVYADVIKVRAADKRSGQRPDALTRALLLDALTRSRDPLHQAKIIDTLLENARKEGLSRAMGQMLLPYVQKLPSAPNLDWFAPRAVEVALIGRDSALTERWLLFVKDAGRRAYPAAEWLPLVGLVQPGLVPQQDGFGMAMRLAKGRRLRGVGLHRLASVLDARQVNVPIPLWNAAGKYKQPNKGALPATGVLSKLKKASEKGNSGEVLFLAMDAVGKHAAHELHLLAIGDLVRSLHKGGFKREAGLFGFEALYGIWPTGQVRFSR